MKKSKDCQKDDQEFRPTSQAGDMAENQDFDGPQPGKVYIAALGQWVDIDELMPLSTGNVLVDIFLLEWLDTKIRANVGMYMVPVGTDPDTGAVTPAHYLDSPQNETLKKFRERLLKKNKDLQKYLGLVSVGGGSGEDCNEEESTDEKT